MKRRRRTIGAGIWRVADPKITMASVASMIVGACVAAHHGPLSWSWLALTAMGIFAFEAAKNASGEIFDWDSGTDQAITDEERTPFSGGKRVIVDGLLTRRQTALVAALFYALGIACGVLIITMRQPAVLWLGVAGAALAFFYHAPPIKLAYRGLGELAVAISYGPIIASGTYLVQRGSISSDVVLASLPLGIAIGAFLWINEFPDMRADRAAGKRTLVVQLGQRRAAVAFPIILAFAYIGLTLLPVAGLPAATLLGIAGIVPAIAAARTLLRYAETPAELIPAQGKTLQSFVLLAIGIGAGFVISSR